MNELFTNICNIDSMPVATTTELDLDTLGRVGEALANPIRRAVLAQLCRAGSAYPGDLARLAGTSRQVLSNHLACLRGCGFVTATYEGRRVRYELVSTEIADVLTRLGALRLGPCPEDTDR